MKPFDRIGEKISEVGRSDIEDQLDGFSRIGWGFDRTVYRIKTGKYGEEYQGKVIKFGASSKGARTANRKEIETWMALENDKELRKHFCPIRDSGKDFKWIIMDYASPVSSFLSRIKSRKKQKMIKKRIEEVEENLDLKHENLGYHQDRGVVFVDYSWGGGFITEERDRTLKKLFNRINPSS